MSDSEFIDDMFDGLPLTRTQLAASKTSAQPRPTPPDDPLDEDGLEALVNKLTDAMKEAVQAGRKSQYMIEDKAQVTASTVTAVSVGDADEAVMSTASPRDREAVNVRSV